MIEPSPQTFSRRTEKSGREWDSMSFPGE